MFIGLLFTDISDHLPVFSISRDQYNDPDTTTPIVYRDKSESNVLKFQNELRNINWPNLKGYNDPSQAYDSFLNEYTAVYNSCFPLKNQIVKRGTLSEPWLSKGLLESISKKNKLYKRYLRNPSPQNEIENAKSHTKSTWRVLVMVSLWLPYLDTHAMCFLDRHLGL